MHLHLPSSSKQAMGIAMDLKHFFSTYIKKPQHFLLGLLLVWASFSAGAGVFFTCFSFA